MPIKVLPPDVASMIAAGEVIERPASVIKELLENSLDAGASAVTIQIQQGGIGSIRITDNGTGIAEPEIELAFARHATSKLVKPEDLNNLSTLGFRGEALPSIAAISKVQIISRTKDADYATMLQFDGPDCLEKSVASAAPGTIIFVENLFDKIPARKKFLKTPKSEMLRIKDLLTHIAFAYPNVAFTLHSDDRLVFQSTGNGSINDIIATVYGHDVAESMINLKSIEEYPIHLNGLVSPASLTRSNRSGICIFANGRWIQNRPITIAIEEAYRGYLTQGKYPIAILFLAISPDQVDVNVHPTKREIRFINESDVFSIVQKSVRRTLLDLSPIPDLYTDEQSNNDYQIQQFAQTRLTASTNSDKFSSQPSIFPPKSLSEETTQSFSMPELSPLAQISNTYIVAEGKNGLYLIDQHAAHEQVLFEKLLADVQVSTAASQPLLDPYLLDSYALEEASVHAVLPILEQYGIRLDEFDGTWLLKSIPALGKTITIADFAAEVVDLIRSPSSQLTTFDRALAASIACHSSVRAGLTLKIQEMQALMDQMQNAENPRHCPHGRPTIVHMSIESLNRQFYRT